MLAAQAGDLVFEVLPLFVAGGQLPAVVGHGHEFHKDDHLAAPVRKLLQESVGGDLL